MPSVVYAERRKQAVMMSVIILNVVMLNVVAPLLALSYKTFLRSLPII